MIEITVFDFHRYHRRSIHWNQRLLWLLPFGCECVCYTRIVVIVIVVETDCFHCHNN